MCETPSVQAPCQTFITYLSVVETHANLLNPLCHSKSTPLQKLHYLQDIFSSLPIERLVYVELILKLSVESVLVIPALRIKSRKTVSSEPAWAT